MWPQSGRYKKQTHPTKSDMPPSTDPKAQPVGRYVITTRKVRHDRWEVVIYFIPAPIQIDVETQATAIAAELTAATWQQHILQQGHTCEIVPPEQAVPTPNQVPSSKKILA